MCAYVRTTYGGQCFLSLDASMQLWNVPFVYNFPFGKNAGNVNAFLS